MRTYTDVLALNALLKSRKNQPSVVSNSQVMGSRRLPRGRSRIAASAGLSVIELKAEIVPELKGHPEDLVITKRQWGAFYGTELDLQLRRRGVHTIVLCGISTNIGVESTARDGYERGYHQVFVEDAMAARSQEEHAHTVTRIFPRIGRVRATLEVVLALRGEAG